MSKKNLSITTAHISSVLLLSVFVFSPYVLNAACGANEFCNPLKFDKIEDLLLGIVDVVIYIMIPIIVLMVIYTGFLFVKAQGNPGELGKAREALMWTLIGAAIVLGAKGIGIAIKSTIDSVVN